MTEQHSLRRLYYEEGKNITEIAKETGRARKTVRGCLEKEDWNEAPSGTPAAGIEFPKLEPFKADIDEWLTEDKQAKRKQRHTAKRVYERLLEKHQENFSCSYRTVAGYVARRRKEIFGQRNGYLPLEHIAGEAQCDFGDAEYYENGRLCGGKYLNLSFPRSNQGYFQLSPGENQECLFEGLIAIFEHIGGVPRRIWFDNTKTIVAKILNEGGRTLTDDFLRFSEHYRFEAVFCNVEAGHEKGNVERHLMHFDSQKISLKSALWVSDEVVKQAVEAMIEIVTEPGAVIAVYRHEVTALMKNAGHVWCSFGTGWGENKATEAAKIALANPVIDGPVRNTKAVVFNITGSPDLTLFEVDKAAEIIKGA